MNSLSTQRAALSAASVSSRAQCRASAAMKKSPGTWGSARRFPSRRSPWLQQLPSTHNATALPELRLPAAAPQLESWDPGFVGSSPQSGTASQGSGDAWQHGKAAVCRGGSCRCSQPLCRGVAQQLQRWHRCRGSADERDPNYRELLGQGAEPRPLHTVSGMRTALGSWLLLHACTELALGVPRGI